MRHKIGEKFNEFKFSTGYFLTWADLGKWPSTRKHSGNSLGRNFQNALVLVKIEESNCCGVVNKWNLEQKNLGPRTGDGRNFRPENDQQINDWRRVRDHEKKWFWDIKLN